MFKLATVDFRDPFNVINRVGGQEVCSYMKLLNQFTCVTYGADSAVYNTLCIDSEKAIKYFIAHHLFWTRAVGQST